MISPNWFLLAAVLALGLAVPAQVATVTAVVEGDLLLVTDAGSSERVRLYGIDCPERGQPKAEDAAKFVSDRVQAKTVDIERVTEDTDGKPVVVVRYGDERNLAHELLTAGLAWWDQNNAPKATELQGLNAKAIIGERGIWSEAVPLAPWDYRLSHGLPAIEYAEDAPPTASAEAQETVERPRVLKLKGDGEFTDGGYEGLGQRESNRPPPTAAPLSALGVSGDTNIAGLGNVNDLMTRHNPRFVTGNNGQVIGFTADDITSLPYVSQFGVREGDIISNVNGRPVRDITDILAMVTEFQDQKNFEVGIVRNGQRITIPVTLP